MRHCVSSGEKDTQKPSTVFAIFFFQVNSKCFDDILEHLQRFKIFFKMGFESQEIKNINSSPYLVVRPWSN